MVEDGAVAVALLGASAALAGLTLVFLGLVMTGYRAFPVGVDQGVRARYRAATLGVAASFLLSLVVVLLAAIWLLSGGSNSVLFHWTAGAFFVQLAVLASSAGWLLYRALWAP